MLTYHVDGDYKAYAEGYLDKENCLAFYEQVEAYDVITGEAESIPMMMWVSACEGKNITNILYRTGLYDFNIVGYLMEGDDYAQVYCVEAATEYEVSQERYGVFGD